MNIPKHEEGLVRIYVEKIASLGVKALEGGEVEREVNATVEKAAAHFSDVKTSTELGNLERFSGLLSVFATSTHGSQPLYRNTFELAKTLVDDIIKKKKSNE